MRLPVLLLVALSLGAGLFPASASWAVDVEAPWSSPTHLARGPPSWDGEGVSFAFADSTLHAMRVAFPNDETVRLTFDAGDERPLEASVRPLTYAIPGRTILRTDALTLEVDHSPFAWRLYDAGRRLVTASGDAPVAHQAHASWKSHWMPAYDTDLTRVSLAVAADTHFYGLGQRFNVPEQGGWTLRSWICDCTQDGNYADKGMGYYSVPFFWTEHGWGALVNSTGDVEWDLADSDPGEARITDPSARPFDLYLFAPGSPKKVLERFSDIVGRPNLPPKWSFEQWVDGVYGNHDGTIKGGEAAMRDYIAHLEAAQIPIRSVVVEDWTTLWWMGARWVWDPAMFPDPAGLVHDLKAKGLKVMMWETPAVGVANTEWPEAAAKGYFAKDATGAPYVISPQNSGALTFWMQGVSIVDFTNPEARAWWQAKHQSLLSLGIDGYKADGGEEPVPDMHFSDGTLGVERHNSNAMLYNRALYDDLVAARGEGAMISRSGGLGSQLASGLWNGDQGSGFPWLRRNLIASLSNSNAGLPWWTFDQGGLSGTMDREEFLRQMQVNVFGSWYKMHLTWDHPRAPWDYDAAATATYRYYSNVRLQLLDYIYHEAEKTHATGVPLVRMLVLDHPDDPAVLNLWDEYQLGDQLLIAPQVYAGRTQRDIHLPEGRWLDLASGVEYRGPIDLKGYATPQELLPLFWRLGGDHAAPRLPPHPALPAGWRSDAVVVDAMREDRPDEHWKTSGHIAGPVAAKTNPVGPVGATVTFDVDAMPTAPGWIHVHWNSGASLAYLQANYLHFSVYASDGSLVAQCDGGAEIMCWIDRWPMTGTWRAELAAWTGSDVDWVLSGFIPH